MAFKRKGVAIKNEETGGKKRKLTIPVKQQIEDIQSEIKKNTEEIEDEKNSDSNKKTSKSKTKAQVSKPRSKTKIKTDEPGEDEDLTTLRNIGPYFAKRLQEIGVKSCSQFYGYSVDQLYEKWEQVRAKDQPGYCTTCVAAFRSMVGAKLDQRWLDVKIPKHLQEKIEINKNERKEQMKKRKIVKVKRE
eukprot:CAMPEP_0115000292 /NCGR_PEP_ID=MMETSP0216-20121206/16669_1 /TAXON_ID=223996 /ORGANISM="Protocruzia adherens, Strain Boccale" /LENGTH=188 /DNA_ID=CAMNT_0002365359 /DNA_START=129 /DNA_END=695 /DNA_ORIENTATION=+